MNELKNNITRIINKTRSNRQSTNRICSCKQHNNNQLTTENLNEHIITYYWLKYTTQTQYIARLAEQDKFGFCNLGESWQHQEPCLQDQHIRRGYRMSLSLILRNAGGRVLRNVAVLGTSVDSIVLNRGSDSVIISKT